MISKTQSVCKWCMQAIRLTTTVDIPELVWVSPDGAVFCPKFTKSTGHEPEAKPASTGEPKCELCEAKDAPKVEEIKYKLALKWIKMLWKHGEFNGACGAALREDGELKELLREADRIG